MTMYWFFLLALLNQVSSSPVQAPLSVETQRKGRFLHITDIHPDPFYHEQASINKACHRPNKANKKSNRAKFYGTPFAECDSPLRLIDYTLDYIDKHWADEVDFVVWTGDSARHDNDRKRPRTSEEIYQLNRAVAQKMEKIFTRRGIPVVPSLGNNDIWPHNILEPGPNSITSEFSKIWSSFIPFPYLQVFQRGAYYSVEVIPDALAVISLNTMYFYDSNKAVGGCGYREPNDPGNLQFDWLEVQLNLFRSRGMQVWLTGHVPPSSGNYFPECYVRYVELSLRFQDTILGHLYGHMNADHFFFVEAVDLNLETPQLRKEQNDLCDALLDDFSKLPNARSMNLDNFGVVNVAPSVVPNPYLPSFRIFSYNATDSSLKVSKKKKGRRPRHPDPGDPNKEELCKQHQYRDSWKCQLNNTWHSDASAPSRSNGFLTPLGFAQYYIPELGAANKTHKPAFKLEYMTFHPAALHPQEPGGWHPIPLKALPKSLRQGPVTESKYLQYKMHDLTIGSWVKLARKLADPESKKLRKKFRNYMFMGESLTDKDLNSSVSE